MVIHLTLQSAYGFKSLLKGETVREAAFDFFVVAAVMELILVDYYYATLIWPFRLAYFVPCVAGAVGAPLLFKCLQSRNGRVGLPGWIGIVLLGFMPNYRFGLYNFGNDGVLMRPGPREILNAPCQTLDELTNGGDPFRVAGMEVNLAGDYSAVYDLEDIRSCAPLSNAKYIQLVQNFPGFSLPKGDWAIRVENPGTARPLLNLLNVKFLLASPGTHPPGMDHFTVRDFNDFKVLENGEAWPRAFFASRVVPVSSNEDFIRYLRLHGDRPFVALEREQADDQDNLRRLENESSPVVVAAEHYRLRPNSTAFDIQTPGAGIVCLTEGQGNDFFAQANGHPAKVLTVNRAFKGIYLDRPGNYHVKFSYRPRFWKISMSLFGVSAGIVLIFGVTALRRAHPPRRARSI